MIRRSSEGDQAGAIVYHSDATSWQMLAADLLLAIDRLEAATGQATCPEPGGGILLAVQPGHDAIRLEWRGPGGEALPGGGQAVLLRFAPPPAVTDVAREDGGVPPNGSVDRAISAVSAGMLSWTKDPDSFELEEHRRHLILVSWAGGPPSDVEEYAYGLWDE